MIPVRDRPIASIIKDLNAALKVEGIEAEESGFSDFTHYDNPQAVADNYYWIACFPVRGSCEGYYAHIELINRKNDTRRLIGIAKMNTFENACLLANSAARLLDPFE